MRSPAFAGLVASRLAAAAMQRSTATRSRSGWPKSRRAADCISVCQGAGSPTAVLTAGLGQWSSAWSPVQRNSPGRRGSAPGTGPASASATPARSGRTSSGRPAICARLLEAAGIEGPYVLVGHSAGGFESMRYADRHPEQVAGMVLVNSTVPDQDRAAAPGGRRRLRRFYEPVEAEYCGRHPALQRRSRSAASDRGHARSRPLLRLPARSCRRRWRPRCGNSTPIRRDRPPQRRCSNIIGRRGVARHDRSAPRYGDLPLIVLTAGSGCDRGDAGGSDRCDPKPDSGLNRGHDALAARRRAESDRRGTSIDPAPPTDVVIAAVHAVVEAARRRSVSMR